MTNKKWYRSHLYKKVGEVIRRVRSLIFRCIRAVKAFVYKFPRPMKLILLASIVLVSGITIGLFERHQMYTISAAEQRLVRASTVDTKFIKDTGGKITYNHQSDTSAKKDKIMTLAAAQMDTTGKAPYRAELSKSSGAIAFSDAEQQRKFKLIPQFSTSDAKYEDGRLTYPVGSSQKHIYTFRTNGLKEDIVLASAPANEVSYSWELELGKDLEAKMMPNGNVGIFSANPYLFGDVQVSDAKSQKLIDAARKKGEKSNLVFVLPAPYIVESNGYKNYSDAAFKLDGSMLTLAAKNLLSKQYPISIDPSIVITTTNDFKQGTDNGMINYASPDEIQRAGISGGSVGAATQQAGAFITSRYGHTSVVYNGYLYIIGGFGSSGVLSDIQYCPINADGSVGTCVQKVNALIAGRDYHSSVAYNGYLYIIGGNNSGWHDDIQYCPIDPSTHTVGTCVQQTSAFIGGGRYLHASAVYNGYLYIVGGYTSAYQNDIQHCPLNANGSVGTCVQQTSAFTTARTDLSVVISNGYVYIIGGYDGTTYYNDIQYCPINANGSVGTCVQQTSAFTTARFNHTSVVSQGYLYVIGGATPTLQNDIQYCPLNANGSVGTCVQQTSAFTTARDNHTSVIYNGYIYVIGGNSSGGTYNNDIQRLAISASASAGTGSIGTTVRQTTAFTTARYNHTSVVYSGYLYIIGGNYDNTSTGNLNDILYCPLDSDGSIGGCTPQTSAFTTPRSSHTSVVNNGYLYIIGGYDGTSNLNDIQHCLIDPSTHAVGTCTPQAAAFTDARSEHTSVVYNNYLYIIGGGGAAGYLNDVVYCPLISDGSVGTCTQQINAFTDVRESHTSNVYNGYLYIIGGVNTSIAENDVQYCPINADGSVGACIQQANAFTNARYDHTSVISGGYLYIIGGAKYGFTAILSDIQYCPINADGSVGTCAAQAAAFTTARFSHTSVVYNNYLYVIGGYNGGSFQNDVQHLALSAPGVTTRGSVGATAQQTGAFLTPRTGHTSVVYNGYLYIIGGGDGITTLDDILYCQLNPDGAVSACVRQASAFTSARSNHTSVVYNGYLYIIGGLASDLSTPLNDVQHCLINPTTHAVGSCGTPQPSPFATARFAHASVVWGGYIYIIGGNNGTTPMNDIQYCQINTTTYDINTCTQLPGAFIGARSGHMSVVYNSYLYIIGGGNGTGYYADIQYCPIMSNGAVGACIQKTGAFTTPRWFHSSVVYNGYLYIIGGLNATNVEQSDILYCPLDANGSVGACTRQTNAYTTGRDSFSSVVYAGYVYIIGGYDGTSYLNDVQHLRTNAPMQRARYEKTIDLGVVAGNISSLTFNGQTKCGMDISYAVAGSSGTFGAVTTITSAQPGVSYTVNQTSIRYVRISASLDDSLCGGTSTITDMSVSYTGSPLAPTLITPAANASIGVLPVFTLRTVDEPTYARYKIEVCSVSDCSVVVRTIDQTASQTGWTGQDAQTSTAYIVSPTISSSTIATHTYQAPALSTGTSYWWRAYAIDPADSNSWSPASAAQLFITQAPPSTPTLISPAPGETSTMLPAFTLRSSDANSDALKYKIDICTTSNCSGILRTIDQTTSQTGWTGQNASGGTAYASNPLVGSSTVATHTYQSPPLTAGNTYWWRAYAIDPTGSNTWSSASAIQMFLTPVTVVNVSGGTRILGGTKIGN
jgi:hypothetical protein